MSRYRAWDHYMRLRIGDNFIILRHIKCGRAQRQRWRLHQWVIDIFTFGKQNIFSYETFYRFLNIQKLLDFFLIWHFKLSVFGPISFFFEGPEASPRSLNAPQSVSQNLWLITWYEYFNFCSLVYFETHDQD